MIFQEDFGRLVIIFIPQLIIAFSFLFIAYRLLSRNRERSTITLSLWYITDAIGLIFNAINALISDLYPGQIITIHVIYFISFYLLFTSNIFLLTFMINLIKSEFSLKRNLFYVIAYFAVCAVLIFVSGGITLDPLNNWRPTFSWPFFIALVVFFTIIILIPTIYYMFKLYALFNAENLKRKFRLFMIGVYGIFITLYGAALFNTWEYELFRTIWSIITVLILVPSAIIIYFGIGPKL
ncbi:MAG: hypothetical protein ACFE8V_06845 [Promethearchaeota archaeon]